MSILCLKSDFFVLGIDPGSRFLGYALLHFASGEFRLLRSGTISFSKTDSLSSRLTVFYYFVLDLITYVRSFSTSTLFLSIESPFVFKNPRSSFFIHSFYSVLLLISGLYSLPFISLSPTEVKKIISGSGKSFKITVLEFVITYFPFITSFSSLDETDAIAIALSAGLKA